jgi:RsiW-degrading membrane proteinase PrsW (M82 family)
VEYATLHTFGAVPLLGVGLIEEAAKLLVPLAVLVLLRRHRQPADGLLLGVAAGAGFAVLETMGYALVALVESQGDLTVLNSILVDRGLLSPAAHMAWTGLAAAALWRAADRRWRGRSMVAFVGVFLLVAVLHALWDGTTSGWAHAGLAVVSMGGLFWTAHRLAAPGHRRWLKVGRGWSTSASAVAPGA